MSLISNSKWGDSFPSRFGHFIYMGEDLGSQRKENIPDICFLKETWQQQTKAGRLDFFSDGLRIEPVWSTLTRCSLIFRHLSPLWIALCWNCTTIRWVKSEKGISQWNWGRSKVPACSVKNSAEDDSHCPSPSPCRPIHKTTEHNDHLTVRQSAHFRYRIKAREPNRPSDWSSNLPHPHNKHVVEQNRVLWCQHTTVHLTKLTV
jgi:hypothetical protein